MALSRSELFRALDTVGEALRDRAQRELGVDVQVPCDIHRGEEHVSQLLEHVCGWLGLGCGLAGLLDRLFELPQLVVEIGQRAGSVRVLELDRGGATLQLSRVQERGQRLGDVVEDAFPAFLLGLDPLPVLPDAAGGARLDVAEDVGMARDELRVDSSRHRGEIAVALLFEQEREEEDLEEQVAELVLELRRVTVQRSVGDLVGLLDRVRNDRPDRLLAVPRAVAAKPLGQALKFEEGFGELFGLSQLQTDR